MSLSKEVLEKYRLAGKIAAEVREHAKRTVFEGMPIIDLCDEIEELIVERGGKPAFPCNVSINEIAAHYTSPPDDKRTVPSGSVVKIDLGVHVDGYIADTAATICFNPEYDNLVTAAEDALKAGVKTITAGLPISKFGSAVQRVIEAHGLKPVANLTGHQVGKYLIHTGKTLPNVSHFSTSRINADEVFAIEPFVTLKNALGRVETGREKTIFRFVKQKSLKSESAKRLCSYIAANFHTLPFAERWLQKTSELENYKAAFSELLSSNTLMSYPIYVEASGKLVAQAEHTVLVTREGCEVLT
jgi:methionyl aminopeptidase